MENYQYARGISSDDLRIFLEFWPRFAALGERIKCLIADDKEIIFGKNSIPFSWCHLYELPVKEHMQIPLEDFLKDEKFLAIFKELVSSGSQIAAMPNAMEKVEEYFKASDDPSEEEAKELVPFLGAMLGLGFSIFNSLRCVLYHGCFLNELILRIPIEGDKILFDAVRIDPTVMGCKPVMARISKATLQQDVKFFAKLKAALTGRIVKREQANFQTMRLVLELLHEAGAVRMNDQQLHQMFVEGLGLYTSNAAGGGSIKALRKFADTYMKKNTTT